MFVWILDCIRSQRWPAAAGLARPVATTHPGREGTVECSCSGRGLSPVSALCVLAALASEMPWALARNGLHVVVTSALASACRGRSPVTALRDVGRSARLDLAVGARP